MRWSQSFIPTLRDDPADAEAASHRLLVRGGFARQLMAGVFSLLPLGFRVRAKIMMIIREEMNAIGGQEVLLPGLHPRKIWETSGRAKTMADILFTLEDHRGADLVLSPTHEEIFTTIARELSSYRELPQMWYHIQTKFRDEPRPKSGLLRVREFTMKDSYTFDVDEAGLGVQFDRHRGAYLKIFGRLGMSAVPVEASSGAMGGSESVEFMFASDAGEDEVVHCPECDYSANVEKAISRLDPIEDGEGFESPEEFPTPGVRTIEDLTVFDGGAAADRQIKTLVYFLDGEPALVLMRGDHGLQHQKLMDGTRSVEAIPADADEIRELLGAGAGSLGAVGVENVNVFADHALQGRRDLTTGANKDDHHVRGVDMDRDIRVAGWLDLREVTADELCPVCGSALSVFTAIEVGHIFKLGTQHSAALGATVVDREGVARDIVMGSYGIGVERNMAAVVEANHDDRGITWPVSIAPYEVVVTVVKPDDAETMATADAVYRSLRDLGVDVIIDDREERPGVKFADAELVGIPFRINVGPRGIAAGLAEVVTRETMESHEVPFEDVAAHVGDLVQMGRSQTR